MTIRPNHPGPPRFADVLGFSCLLVFSCLVMYFLVDSGRDWVSTFFVKQVARIHFHQETKVPYGELRPPLESVWYDPVDRNYVVSYGIRGGFGPTISISPDGSVRSSRPPSR